MFVIGRVVAWLALIFGVLRIGVGFFVVSIDDPASRAAAAARYLGYGTGGNAIDQGFKVALFGLVLGILVKIGQAITSLSRGKD